MSDEARERSLLAYLSSDLEDHQRYRSLTTIFEQFDRPDQWKSSYALDVTIDDKESLRSVLDEMVLDGLVEGRMGARDYERSYRLSDQGLYEVFAEEPLVIVELPPQDEAVNLSVDSKQWTGLTDTIIDSRNAKIVSGMIEKAIDSLPASGAGNFHIMQATAYLKAAKELVDAPEPPSQLIWQLISRAADVIGIFGFFYTIFFQAAN